MTASLWLHQGVLQDAWVENESWKPDESSSATQNDLQLFQVMWKTLFSVSDLHDLLY
jgi:hypothetical protein